MIKNIEQPYNWYNLEPNYRKYLLAVKKIQPVSIKNYVSDIKYFFGWISTVDATDFSPSAILTTDILDHYRSFLISNHLPVRTVNRRLSSLRSFCDFLLSQNIIQSDPSKHIRNFSSKPPVEDELVSKFEQSRLAQGGTESDLAQMREDVREFIHLAQINSI